MGDSGITAFENFMLFYRVSIFRIIYPMAGRSEREVDIVSRITRKTVPVYEKVHGRIIQEKCAFRRNYRTYPRSDKDEYTAD